MKLALALTLSCLFASTVFADAAIHADKQAVDSACAAEGSAAGCGADKVGSGLIRCIRHYKHHNPAFTISNGCQSAIGQLKQDKADHK